MKKLSVILFAMLVSISNLYAADVASGKGTVNKIDVAASKVNLSHEAIPAIKWPAMTMDIPVADKKILTGIKQGQVVTFGLTKDAEKGYVISHIEPAK